MLKPFEVVSAATGQVMLTHAGNLIRIRGGCGFFLGACHLRGKQKVRRHFCAACICLRICRYCPC